MTGACPSDSRNMCCIRLLKISRFAITLSPAPPKSILTTPQAGNLSPNIGRPLRDYPHVGSSWSDHLQPNIPLLAQLRRDQIGLIRNEVDLLRAGGRSDVALPRHMPDYLDPCERHGSVCIARIDDVDALMRQRNRSSQSADAAACNEYAHCWSPPRTCCS